MLQEGAKRCAGGGITTEMGGLKKTFPAQGEESVWGCGAIILSRSTFCGELCDNRALLSPTFTPAQIGNIMF